MNKVFFFCLSVILTLPAMAQQFPQPSDCRSRIARIVCLVDSVNDPDNESDFFKRPCLAGSDHYQEVFERHYDRAPDVIKSMYCHLDKVFVETQSISTAYATPIVDANGKITAGAVGIRKEALDNPPTYTEWLSWKEEISFGGSKVITGPGLDLIRYNSNMNTPELFIDFLMAHEFGHLFDMANKLNQLIDCRWEEDANGEERLVGSCAAAPGSWTALSWQTATAPLPDYDYPLRKETCFYSCNGKFLSAADSTTIFNGLLGSNFVSTYAASNIADDWAETFAYFVMTQTQGFQLSVETSGNIYNLTGHFTSDLLASKRAYINTFLRSPFLYPGEGSVLVKSRRKIIDR